MRYSKLLAVTFMLITLSFMVLDVGCSNNGTITTPTVQMPQPQVVSVSASTSGTQGGYYATLDIRVKNSGAEGTILVNGSITQNGNTEQNQMPVFLSRGETHELKLTFPLVWNGGAFTTNVQAVLPNEIATSTNSLTASGQNTLFSSQTISQGPSVQTMVYKFTPNYSGYISITGNSSSSTGYIMVTNTTSAVSSTYTFGTGSGMNASLTANQNYTIYFGNHDTTGTITATLTGVFQP